MHKPFKKTFALLVALGSIAGAFALGAVVVVMSALPVSATLPLVELTPDATLANAAVIYDPQSGRILYQKNADEPLPLASLTKLMTATVALKDHNPSLPVAITPNNLAPNNNWGLKPGETFALDTLIKLALIASSNDAITAAASSAGSNYIDQMNNEAAAMGLTETHFLDPTGLDLDAQTAGSYGSAYDVARLAAAFYKAYPAYFEVTTSQDAIINAPDGTTQEAAATAAPLFNIPGLIGAKTGYTNLAGGNLVAAFDLEPGYPLIAAVLGSTETGRFDDIHTLVGAARNQLVP